MIERTSLVTATKIDVGFACSAKRRSNFYCTVIPCSHGLIYQELMDPKGKEDCNCHTILQIQITQWLVTNHSAGSFLLFLAYICMPGAYILDAL